MSAPYYYNYFHDFLSCMVYVIVCVCNSFFDNNLFFIQWPWKKKMKWMLPFHVLTIITN